MSGKIVVYTAIFGNRDGLLPQKKCKGVDYLCFSDQKRRASPWDVRIVLPEYADPTRAAKVFKILPHHYLSDYEWSIWIDGNYLAVRNMHHLIATLPASTIMACFDHQQTGEDARNCIYKEYAAILEMGKMSGKYKDDPATLTRQIERYRAEGYPAEAGLISGGVLCRRHNESAVKKCMEAWWQEICNESRRDQLSFNYVAWKQQFNFHYLPGNIRNNRWFYQIGIHRSNYCAKLFRYRLKRFFGLIRHQ